MSDEIKARLPFGPEDPWYDFATSYEALPFKATTAGKYKELKVRSDLSRLGLLISSTITDTEEIGRLSLPNSDADRLGEGLRRTLEEWGWDLLPQGPTRTVLRKKLPLEKGATSMPMAFLNVLPLLGVDPEQDWLA